MIGESEPPIEYFATKYGSPRNEVLGAMLEGGWGNESSGDVEAPTGHFCRISNSTQELQEVSEVFSDILGEMGRYGIKPSDLLGHFLLITDSNGFVNVNQYDTAEELTHEYNILDEAYSVWLQAQEQPTREDVEVLERRLAVADSRIGELESQRNELRDRAGSYLSQLQNFKREVKRIAIEQMREGRWCMGGMNEKLEELGLEPYVPRYIVSLAVELVMEVYADDEDDAADTARRDLTIKSDDDNYIDVGDVHVRLVEESDDE